MNSCPFIAEATGYLTISITDVWSWREETGDLFNDAQRKRIGQKCGTRWSKLLQPLILLLLC